jgi:hypothetical protein
MNYRLTTIALLAAVAGFGTAPAEEGAAPAGGKSKEVTEVRIFDISSLVAKIVDYPGPEIDVVPTSGSHGHFELFTPGDAPQADMTVDYIVELMRMTIEPSYWADESRGALSANENQLVVRAKPDVMSQCEQFLRKLSATRISSQLAVQARILKDASIPREHVLDKDPQERCPTATLIAAPRLICYNKQRAHVLSGRKVSYVRDLDCVSGEGGVGYDPVMGVALDGCIFDVRPVLAPDTASAALTLRLTLGRNLSLNPQRLDLKTASRTSGTTSSTRTAAPKPKGGDEKKSEEATGQAEPGETSHTLKVFTDTGTIPITMAIDKPSIDRQIVRTDVTVPLGKWVLASVLPNPDAQDAQKHILVYVSADVVGK